jgi:hypothetical protein
VNDERAMPTVLRISMYEKGQAFLREAARLGCRVVLLTVEGLLEDQTWITVGPNGTDISTGDGKNWRLLKPSLKDGEPADADQNWNALSLPFVVGPKGRIGKLYPAALKP